MIQRYNFEIGYNFVEGHDCTDGCCMEPNNDGKYVKFSDHEADKAAALAEKDKEIERRVREINACYGFQKNQTAEIKQWRDMCEKMDLQLRELLMSAESEWENKRLGHDWAEACESTRELLAAYNAMKEDGK